MAKGLVDQWGEPIPPETIALMREEISAPSAISARPPFAGHLAFGIDPAALGAIVRAADAGQTLGYMTIAEEIEELYPHYGAVLAKRKRAVCQLPVTVEAAGTDAEAVKHADFVREWLDEEVLGNAMFDTLDALGKGYSASEIIWDVSRDGTRPSALLWRTQRFFEISWHDGQTLWLRSEGGFQDLAPHKFLVHRAGFKSGNVVRGGLTRAIVFLWLFAAYTQRDWAMFTQGYGLPMRLGRYGPEASASDKRVLWRAVQSIAGDVAAIIPKSMEVEFVKADTSRGGHELFLTRVDWLDRATSKVVLGGTAGTDAIAGGHAVGKEHRDVEGDVERFDAGRLAVALTRQVVQAMVAFTFGPQKKYPRLVIGRPDEVPIEKVVAAVGDLASLGLTVKADQIRERLQLEKPEDGDEVIGGIPPTPAPTLPIPHLPIPPGGASPQVAAHAAAGRPESAARGLLGRLLTLQSEQAPELVAALSERLDADAAGALAGMTEAIRAEVEAAVDLRDLGERLEKLKLDPAAFAEAMQRGLALAHMAGQAELLGEIGMVRKVRH
jgi:phage gp29-like protein